MTWDRQKILTLALRFIARRGLLEKFTEFLKCSAANEKAELEVEEWIARGAYTLRD